MLLVPEREGVSGSHVILYLNDHLSICLRLMRGSPLRQP